jgi:transposase
MAFLAEEIESLDQDIATLIRESNLTTAYELLQSIPGIRSQAAATILAESGPDMKQFPKAANFSSWSGLAPGNNQSAGKKKRAPALKGNPHIKTALVEAAWSASRTKQSEFEDRYQRLKSKIGHKRAIVASAHTVALRVYEVLDSGLPYQHRGANLTPRSINRLVRHHTRRLKCLHRWLDDKGITA